jgi:hypothetical protein
VGFRGPGFSWSPELLELLSTREYLYDASTLPSFLGPVARWYFLARSGLSPEERRRRGALYGTFRDGLRPLRPYRWQLRSGSHLLEIPITTFPVIRLPFHMSYLIYLSRFSRGLMRTYLRTGLELCLRSGVNPSFLLHPLDILGRKEAPELAFFPGMDLPTTHKRAVVREVIDTLAAHFTLVTMSSHAAQALAHQRLVVLEPGARRLDASGPVAQPVSNA